MISFPNYDEWKLASPCDGLEFERELDALELLAGQVAEVEHEHGERRYHLSFRGTLSAADAAELIELRHEQLRRRR